MTSTPYAGVARERWLQPLLTTWFLLLLGALVAHVSLSMHPRFLTLNDAIASQHAIYARTPATFDGYVDDIRNWRNRVMIPYWMEGLAGVTGMRFSQAYLLTRWLTATLALAAFMRLARRTLGLSSGGGAAASAFFALSLLPTFMHLYEIPSDFLDAAFFAALTLLAVEKRRGAFTAVLLVALLNRESAIFALIVWFFLHAGRLFERTWWREFFWCGVFGLLGTALVLGVRMANTDRDATVTHAMQTFYPRVFWEVNLRLFREFMARPNFSHPYFFLGGYVGLVALAVGSVWRRLPEQTHRLLAAALAIFLVSIISNNLNELRIFIPSLVLCSLALVEIVSAGFLEPRAREGSSVSPLA